VQALVTAGHITEEEAEEHPMRNVLYRALGQATDVEIDIYYEKLRVGDRMVLCSDGLTLHLKPDEIAQIVLASENPNEASQKLIEMANNRGGRDNVSTVVIKVERDTSGDTQDMSKVAAENPMSEEDFDYLNEDTLIIDRNSYHSSESPAMPSDKDRDSKSKLSIAKDVPPPTPPPKKPEAPQHDALAESGEVSGNRSNETRSDSAGEGNDPLGNFL